MATHRDHIVDQFTRQAVPFATAGPIRDERALQLLVTATGAGPEDTVLDVACGPGIVACAFGQVARQVTGIDLTPAMLDQGRALAAELHLTNVTFELGDVLPLPYPDASFSIVVSRFAFHHFQDPGAVLAEMKRVCRPGGRVTVADLTVSPDPVKAEAFHQMEILRDPSHARGLTLSQLQALFPAAGLPTPEAAYWQMKIDVDDLLTRSFPVEGSEATIRRMFADSVDDDALGLGTRREGQRIRFDYANVILTATR